MSMHCCINIYNTKLLYRFERNNSTYLDYDDDCFNNDECDFNITILVGI